MPPRAPIPPPLPGSPIPFVVGAGRSGTTMFRLMLDAHGDLAIPPETGFLEDIERLVDGGRSAATAALEAIAACHNAEGYGLSPAELARAFADLHPGREGIAGALRAFYRLYAARFGKPRGGDKTPIYASHMVRIARHLPEAHFLHLIRDGRDVATSIRPLWFAPSRDVGEIARWWRGIVLEARSQARELPHYREVRYEQLIADTARELAAVCALLELPYQESMLEFHHRSPARLVELGTVHKPSGEVLITGDERRAQQRLTGRPPERSRIGRFREVLTPAEIDAFEREAGDLLAELGYEVGATSPSKAPDSL